jgi:predicted DCC family thiol-disulfide oxidoreductase YuxK
MHAVFTDRIQENATPLPKSAVRGWVLYDGACGFCTSLVERFGPALLRRGYRCAALQEPWVAGKLGLGGDELLSALRVLEPGGASLAGADAIVHLARRIVWAWPLYFFAQLPGMMRLLRAGYARVAASRYCLSAMRRDCAGSGG